MHLNSETYAASSKYPKYLHPFTETRRPRRGGVTSRCRTSCPVRPRSCRCSRRRRRRWASAAFGSSFLNLQRVEGVEKCRDNSAKSMQYSPSLTSDLKQLDEVRWPWGHQAELVKLQPHKSPGCSACAHCHTCAGHGRLLGGGDVGGRVGGCGVLAGPDLAV